MIPTTKISYPLDICDYPLDLGPLKPLDQATAHYDFLEDAKKISKIVARAKGQTRHIQRKPTATTESSSSGTRATNKAPRQLNKSFTRPTAGFVTREEVEDVKKLVQDALISDLINTGVEQCKEEERKTIQRGQKKARVQLQNAEQDAFSKISALEKLEKEEILKREAIKKTQEKTFSNKFKTGIQSEESLFRKKILDEQTEAFERLQAKTVHSILDQTQRAANNQAETRSFKREQKEARVQLQNAEQDAFSKISALEKLQKEKLLQEQAIKKEQNETFFTAKNIGIQSEEDLARRELFGEVDEAYATLRASMSESYRTANVALQHRQGIKFSEDEFLKKIEENQKEFSAEAKEFVEHTKKLFQSPIRTEEDAAIFQAQEERNQVEFDETLRRHILTLSENAEAEQLELTQNEKSARIQLLQKEKQKADETNTTFQRLKFKISQNDQAKKLELEQKAARIQLFEEKKQQAEQLLKEFEYSLQLFTDYKNSRLETKEVEKDEFANLTRPFHRERIEIEARLKKEEKLQSALALKQEQEEIQARAKSEDKPVSPSTFQKVNRFIQSHKTILKTGFGVIVGAAVGYGIAKALKHRTSPALPPVAAPQAELALPVVTAPQAETTETGTLLSRVTAAIVAKSNAIAGNILESLEKAEH